MTLAPDFNSRGTYPSQGYQIGPAWTSAWLALETRGALPSTELVWLMCDVSGILPKTAVQLLREARRAGKISVSYKMINSRRTAVYQVR